MKLNSYFAPYTKSAQTVLKILTKVKLIEANLGENFITFVLAMIAWIRHQKRRQLHQTKKLPYNKETIQQSENATHGMGENICKLHILERVNL